MDVAEAMARNRRESRLTRDMMFSDGVSCHRSVVMIMDCYVLFLGRKPTYTRGFGSEWHHAAYVCQFGI